MATPRRAHLVSTTGGSDSLSHTISLPSVLHRTIFTYCADRHVLTSMVRYVILRRFLREIPSWISFRDPRVLAWLTPRGGHLRGIATPDLANWGAGLSPKDLPANVPAATGVIDEDYRDILDKETEDWTADDGNSRDYLREDPPSPQTITLAVDTRHGVGRTKLGTARPSDTCPHTCTIINQNVNGLGGRKDNKLEKVISLMIDRNIHAYYIQETWQLCDYMLTIRGFTIFHHGMNDKPQQLGRVSAGVMIILDRIQRA